MTVRHYVLCLLLVLGRLQWTPLNKSALFPYSIIEMNVTHRISVRIKQSSTWCVLGPDHSSAQYHCPHTNTRCLKIYLERQCSSEMSIQALALMLGLCSYTHSLLSVCLIFPSVKENDDSYSLVLKITWNNTCNLLTTLPGQ